MNMLLFSINEKPHAINTRDIIKIIPNIHIKPNANYPVYVAGTIHYHGNTIPIIDLGLLYDNTRCNAHFSTRIILIKSVYYKKEYIIGLLAEHVTTITTFNPAKSQFQGSGSIKCIDIGKLKSKISLKEILNRKAVT